MGPHTETTYEAGLLMWWSMDRLKPPADEGHSITFRTATPLALSCSSFKSLEEELGHKGKGKGFGRRKDAFGVS